MQSCVPVRWVALYVRRTGPPLTSCIDSRHTLRCCSDEQQQDTKISMCLETMDSRVSACWMHSFVLLLNTVFFTKLAVGGQTGL